MPLLAHHEIEIHMHTLGLDFIGLQQPQNQDFAPASIHTHNLLLVYINIINFM
jgi:hypothetical protein